MTPTSKTKKGNTVKQNIHAHTCNNNLFRVQVANNTNLSYTMEKYCGEAIACRDGTVKSIETRQRWKH